MNKVKTSLIIMVPSLLCYLDVVYQALVMAPKMMSKLQQPKQVKQNYGLH